MPAAAPSVYDLAVDVFLYLAAFQRRVADGEDPRYEDTRNEVLALIKEQDRKSHAEPGLWDAWSRARVPLVYLIDEVMILNCPWSGRQRWADECLEITLLNQREALGGEKFYDVVDQAMKETQLAEEAQRSDTGKWYDLLATCYACIQLGFKGKYAVDPDTGRDYATRLFAKLPAYAQTRAKSLFPEAAQHTVKIDPNYEPLLRLAYVLLLFGVILAVYLIATGGYWRLLTSELREHARETRLPTISELPDSRPTGG
ncbi:MAG: DotU family type IV/VI secretion system protein [Phycisphaerae bacterium]|nr:DotU family type IV/VI secretion system protein [Phycisphaerae bacterium]